MATTFYDKGRSDVKPRAIIVHAYEEGRQLPTGVFFGYVRGNRVSLYPADTMTSRTYKDIRDISIYDLKERRSV